MNTTTHPLAPEEVMAFVDGELSADRAQSLSAHIDQCAECSTLAVDFRGLSGQIAGWQVELVPERLSGLPVATAEKYTRDKPLLGSAAKQRRSPAFKFAVVIASGFAALLLFLAIAVPNLLRSRMAANEASAVGSLRTLNTAAITYSDIYGHFPPSLESFGPPSNGKARENAAGLVDPLLAGGRKSGYLFIYQTTPPEDHNSRGGYTINAEPLEPGKGAQRRFSTDQTGTLFADGTELSGPVGEQQTVRHFSQTAPLIARTADLKLLVEKLDDARQGMDQILTQHKGYVAHLSANAESGSARTVIASLRVPADQLDACIAELKKLGRVAQESQAGEEVTQQHADLVARLKNSRNTEARLNDVLQQGGKVKDVLDVERESARVRGEIEQMEAEQKNLEHRVDFATIDLKVAEEYKAQLSSPAPSVGTQLRNATVNGFRNAFESLLSLVLFLAESGPTLLLWLALLSFPAWLLWRRYQRAQALSSSLGA